MIKSRQGAFFLKQFIRCRQHSFTTITQQAFRYSSLTTKCINYYSNIAYLNPKQTDLYSKFKISMPMVSHANQHRASNGFSKALYQFSTQKQSNSDIKNIRLIDIKNDHILVIQDKDSALSYLRQVIVRLKVKNSQKVKQYRGVVLKIQQQKQYIGLYQHISSQDLDNLNLNDPVARGSLTVQIKKLSQSLRDVQLPLYTHCIINAENKIEYLEEKTSTIFNKIKIESQTKSSTSKQQQANFVHNEGRRKIQTSSILLTACYDMYYGDMLIFEGGIGSGRTKLVENIITDFIQPNSNNKSNNHIAIYVNLNKRDCQKIIKNLQKQSNTQNFIIFTQEKPTNTSSYIMSVKAIETAKKLAQRGYNVLIAIDGFKQMLVHEWSLITGIKTSLLPISITNQLYSSSMDFERVLSKQKNAIKRGSLTSIVVCENSDLYGKAGIQNVQEISMYSNTIKHLMTLNSSVKFPLDFKTNHNNLSKKVHKIKAQQSQEEYDLSKNLSLVLRKYINHLLTKKHQFQLKSQLNLTKDQPWQHYFLLDSKWWSTGIKKFQPDSILQRNHFMLFVIWNIQDEISSQWTITCIDAFKKYQQFIREKSKYEAENNQASNQIYSELFLNRQIFGEFLNECKLNDLIEPFKKDYLP